MRFKSQGLQVEFESALHFEVRDLVIKLNDWSVQNGIPSVIVTHVVRYPAQQEAFYWRQIAREKCVDEETARALARKKFSWHLVKTAIDLRNNHYTQDQLSRVMAFLKVRCTPGPWELLEHDVGRGDHIHIGRRDFVWRRQQMALLNQEA